MQGIDCSASPSTASSAVAAASATSSPSSSLPKAVPADPELADRFSKLHSAILRGLKQEHGSEGGNELINTISLRLQREFDRPRIEELEFCMQRRFTADQARVLLFFPTSEEGFGMIELWPLLVAEAPDGAPSDHPQRKLQLPFLTLLYLCHVRDWSFAREFVLHGGLTALARLMCVPNAFLRNWVVSSFMMITGTANFDWFEPPSKFDRKLHARMLELANPSIGLIAALLRNKDPPPSERFPGGTCMCLKILAFWLSWVRKLHCKTHELRLSQKILDELEAWSRCQEGVQEESEVSVEEQDKAGIIPLYRSKEELELAQKLFEDFSRFGPAEDGSAVSGLDSQDASSEAHSASSPLLRSSSASPPASASFSSTSIPTPTALKERGNDLFRAKDYNAAIEAYTQGIALSEKDAELRAKLLSNRAKAKLKVKAAGGSHDSILEDLDAAIAASPGFLRPYLTKAEILYQAGAYETCRTTAQLGKAATKAGSSSKSSSPLSSSDAKIVKSLESLDRKCIMACAMEKPKATASVGVSDVASESSALKAAGARATPGPSATRKATTSRKAKEEDLVAAILARSGGGGGGGDDDNYSY